MRKYIPKYDLASRIQHTKYDPEWGIRPSARLDRVETPETTDFKQVLSGLMEDLNEQANAPDSMMKDVMSGNKNVDIHDVMTAMAKAEISINVATQVTGKIINAYDRVMQISV